MSQVEMLRIFNERYEPIGVASRDEVHTEGYWHETFHCWFIEKAEDAVYIFLQLRSKQKKDYPNLFDITAAGHLEAHETVKDGIREVKEELGIELTYEDLFYCGSIPYEVQTKEIIDKEIAHVHLLEFTGNFDVFNLQQEEVSGMVKARLEDFMNLWLANKETIHVEGFFINENNQKMTINKTVKKDAFVQHKKHYYEELLNIMQKNYSIL